MNMAAPLLYDSHMHTPLCQHAWGTPEEYAAAAERRGLKGIIFTCHNPGPEEWSPKVRMRMDQFPDYMDMVQGAQEAWRGRVDVQLGLEFDYMPGLEPLIEELLAKAELHHVLGSVHPQLPYYKDEHFNGSILAYQKLYFRHLAMAAETGLFDTLGHPDLVKNVFPDQWRLEEVMDDIRDSLDRIARAGIAMELNTSGLQKEIREMNPNPPMLSEMRQRGIPVVLGSDAHAPHRVGANFTAALDILSQAGYEEVHYYVGRIRQRVSIGEARASLTAAEPADAWSTHGG